MKLYNCIRARWELQTWFDATRRIVCLFLEKGQQILIARLDYESRSTVAGSPLPHSVLGGTDLRICLQKEQQTGRGKVSTWGSGDVTDTESQGANICHLQLGMAVTLVCFMIGGKKCFSLPLLCSIRAAAGWGHVSIVVSNYWLKSSNASLCLLCESNCVQGWWCMYLCVYEVGEGDEWMKEGRDAACQMNSDRGLLNCVGVLWYF